MKAKAYSIYGLIVLMFCAALYSIYKTSGNPEYIYATERQSEYRLDVAVGRGVIYDCNMMPLVNESRKKVAAVIPSIEAVGELIKHGENINQDFLLTSLRRVLPFTIEVADDFDVQNIDVFDVPRRYSEKQLAPHIIGYLNSEGNGAAGVELSMNDILKDKGRISVTYQVNAMQRTIAGGKKKIENTLQNYREGVVLTLDANIQKIVQKAAEKLESGAVVVTEVPNCEIRAIASVPDFKEVNSNRAGAYMNKAFSAYSPGSIFKLIGAAGEMEAENDGYVYDCKGFIEVDGLKFYCYDRVPHGKVNIISAIEKSCNGYFITAAQKQGVQSMLAMAYNMGFGIETEFGRGLFTSAGNVPNVQALLNERAFANFSFGQGELTVTPLQVTVMMNAIVSGGEYAKPKLFAGTVDNLLKYTPIKSEVIDKRIDILSDFTAMKLVSAMEQTVRTGTAKKGEPENCRAGAKTGTAQTGIYRENVELNHYWYAGYIKEGNMPRYCITVLKDAAIDENGDTAAVFKEVAEKIAESVFYSG